MNQRIIYRVSIPFKRESVFRVVNDSYHKEICVQFQFPSNGKVYSELSTKQSMYNNYYSVFQFPSNGKVYSEFSHRNPFSKTHWVHVSIPFKRESVFRVVDSRCKLCLGIKSFNSLQTGKCIQSTKNSSGISDAILVSIPFKRESVFRVSIEGGNKAKGSALFQFPSNGKVYSEA